MTADEAFEKWSNQPHAYTVITSPYPDDFLLRARIVWMAAWAEGRQSELARIEKILHFHPNISGNQLINAAREKDWS